MSAGEIHKNDIGTVFQITVKDGTTVVDVSSATTRQFIFTKPNGSKLTVTATLVNTGTDGKIKYAFVSGDLNVVGRWRYQVKLVISTSTWHSDVGYFTVNTNL